jgi:hypothetical protein
MKTLRWFTKWFTGNPIRHSPTRPTVRLRLEQLEGRLVPNTYTWSPLSGDSNWSWTNGNAWVNNVGPGNAPYLARRGTVPTDTDDVMFGGDLSSQLGTNGVSCTIPAGSTIAVHSVQMEDNFTGALNLGVGTTFATTTDFREHGALNLLGGNAIDCGASFYINGAVTAQDNGLDVGSGGAGSELGSANGFFLSTTENFQASVTAQAAPHPGPGAVAVSLVMNGPIDMGGNSTIYGGSQLNVAAPAPIPGTTAFTPSGSLTLHGNVETDVTSVVNVNAGALLTLAQQDVADGFDVKGTLNLYGGSGIANAGAQDVSLDGGFLNVWGDSGITGNLLNDNGGTINFADTLGAPPGGPAPLTHALAIVGNYQQVSSVNLEGATYGTLNIGIQGGLNDFLAVGLNAVLGGNLNVAVEAAAPLPAHPPYAWGILTAGLGVEGNWGGGPAAMQLPPGFAGDNIVVPGPGPFTIVTVA